MNWTFKNARVFLCGVLSLGVAVAVADCQDVDRAVVRRADDSKMVEGLRRRRLFALAEAYCSKRLAEVELDATSESVLTIELIKTLTAKAILSPPAARASVWAAADQMAVDFLQEKPGHPRAFLVRAQRALSHIAHADLIQQELAAEITGDSDRESAFSEIRTSRSLLGNLQRDIANKIPEQRGSNLGEHDLTVPQLLSLNNNVRYQLVVCNLNRAKLYGETDRLNRVDALNVVQEKLIEVQREASERQPLWWKCKLGQIECFLLTGKMTQARLLFDALPAEDVDADVVMLLLEQRARLAMATGDRVMGEQVVVAIDSLDATTPQLDLALLELAVNFSSRATTDRMKQQWLDLASKKTRKIEQVHGAYWGRRAGLILIEGVGSTGQTPNLDRPRTGQTNVERNEEATPDPGQAMSTELDLLVRLANQAFEKEQFDDALKAYGRAEVKAASEGSQALAFRLGVRACQTLERLGKNGMAATRLLESSKRQSELPIASAAHLRGCWNFAQTISEQNPASGEKFEQMLDEHLKIWPRASSSDQVRMWLGGRFQTAAKWGEAIAVYVDVDINRAQSSEAIKQVSVCARNILHGQRRDGKPTQAEARRLVALLARWGIGLDESNSASVRLFLLQTELDLTFGAIRSDPQVVLRLNEISKSGADDIQGFATAILASAISRDSPANAHSAVARIGNDLPSLRICDRCLEATIRFSNDSIAIKHALKTRLHVIDSALALLGEPEGSTPTSSRRLAWLMKKSRTWGALGESSKSIQVLESLEASFPRSAEIKMELARATTNQYQETNPGKPLARWRALAKRLKPHTDNWYEAKYNVALMIFKSGDADAASKLLNYLKAIPPGWERSTFKAKFDKLFQNVESNQ